jgi:hypothetical protein
VSVNTRGIGAARARARARGYSLMDIDSARPAISTARCGKRAKVLAACSAAGRTPVDLDAGAIVARKTGMDPRRRAARERASLRAHAHRRRPSYEDINHALSWTMLAITHA